MLASSASIAVLVKDIVDLDVSIPWDNVPLRDAPEVVEVLQDEDRQASVSSLAL